MHRSGRRQLLVIPVLVTRDVLLPYLVLICRHRHQVLVEMLNMSGNIDQVCCFLLRILIRACPGPVSQHLADRDGMTGNSSGFVADLTEG